MNTLHYNVKISEISNSDGVACFELIRDLARTVFHDEIDLLHFFDLRYQQV